MLRKHLSVYRSPSVAPYSAQENGEINSLPKVPAVEAVVFSCMYHFTILIDIIQLFNSDINNMGQFYPHLPSSSL